MILHKELKKRASKYPLYSQENEKSPMIIAKLFNIIWRTNWYIAEYDPETKIAYGYVEALMPDSICDEWWYVSIDELQSLYFFSMPIIELDLSFEEVNFSKLKVR